MQIHLVSLGCARNLVDSEIVIGLLQAKGWRHTADATQAEVIIVNTCSFIEDAVNESIDTILDLAQHKNEGRCRYLIVAGCMPERYRESVAPDLPEVDLFLGTGALDQIVTAVDRFVRNDEMLGGCRLPDPDCAPLLTSDESRALSNRHFAYLKIAEGCSRRCTYCIIPRLRGRQKSRLPDDVIREADQLRKQGVNELVLIAQDTTGYGRDLAQPHSMAALLDSLAERWPQGWIRFLYGHPDGIDGRLLSTVARHANLCSYFDIPIQHASGAVLKRMGRGYDGDDLQRMFATIRRHLPEAALRTTVIVGFPGETDEDFEQLLQMVETIRFDHLGAFCYSDADDLASHRLPDHVPADVARERRDRLMTLQADISLRNNLRYIGQTVKVLVEDSPDGQTYTGRTDFQAPEVDGMTFIKTPLHGTPLAIGSFARVRITKAMAYDIEGDAL
jgi:ribosomal protein S12 methylthiotransferase